MGEEFDPTIEAEPITVSEPVTAEKPKRTRKKPVSKAKREERSESIERMMAWLFAGLAGWIYANRNMPEECEPSKEEAYMIVGPLVHIYDRHAPDLPEVSEDVIDAGMFVAGLLVYSRRVSKVLKVYQKAEEEKARYESIPFTQPENGTVYNGISSGYSSGISSSNSQGHTTDQSEISTTVPHDRPARKKRQKRNGDASIAEAVIDESSERGGNRHESEQSNDPITDLLRRDAESRRAGNY